MEKENLLNVIDASYMLRVTRNTLYRWAKKNYLNPIRIGGKIFYKKADVQKLMKGEKI